MENDLNLLLGLERVKISKVVNFSEGICLKLFLTNIGISCPHCENYITEFHQDRPTLVRDLSCFGRVTYLLVPRRQFYCSYCQRYPTEKLEWIDWKRRHTSRYESNIFERVISSNIANVAQEEGVSFEEIEGIFNWVSKKGLQNNWEGSKRISIDEISMHKGQGNYKAVLCDIDKRKLLEIIDGRTQDVMIAKLSELSHEVRMSIEEVSVDMWKGFKKVIEEIFPNAKIVTDRFHVMKLLLEELKKIAKASKVKKADKVSLILRNNKNLNDREKEELALLLNKSKRLQKAYEYKEEFREIYETATTVAEGKDLFEEWLKKARKIYGKVIQTIREHLPTICNYFISHASSGVMEGINNKVKLIKRQGYGFRNFENFRRRLLATFSN